MLPGSTMASDEGGGEGGNAHSANNSVAVRISPHTPPAAGSASPAPPGALLAPPVPRLKRTAPTNVTATVSVQPTKVKAMTLAVPGSAEAAAQARTAIVAGTNARAPRKSVYGARRQSRAAGKVNGRGGWEESESGSSGKFRFGYDSRGVKLSLWAAIAAWLSRHWVLNPKGSYRWYWNLAVFLILMYYIIEIPLRLGFHIDDCNTCATTVLHLLMDIFFCIDCLALQSRTSYFLDDLNKTLLETSPRKIFTRYLRGWFVFDLVTSLPVHHVLVYYVDMGEDAPAAFFVQFSYLLRMFKIFRFLELLQYFHSVELSAGTIWADLLKVFKFVFGFFCIAHMSACLWMFIALRERVLEGMDGSHVAIEDSKWRFDSWPGGLGYIAYPPNVTEMAMLAADPTKTGVEAAILYNMQTQARAARDVAPLTTDLSYLMALYWAVSTMTTVGYGDITPRNDAEIAYACVVIFIGAVAFGYIISNVSSILQIEDDTDTKIRDKIASINAYMAHRKLPPEMQKKIRNHYEYTWKRKTVYDEREILQQLPTYLRTRVALYLNQDLIRNVAFLRDLGSDCLALLVTELRPFRVGAGYWIFKQGSLGREMCFVAEGVVEVLGKKNKQLTVLQRGAYFGEFSVLSDKPTKRSASVRALAATDLLALTKKSFDSVLRVYPELKEEVQAHAEARLAEAMQGKEERDYTMLPPLPTAATVVAQAQAAGVTPSTPKFGRNLLSTPLNLPRGSYLSTPRSMSSAPTSVPHHRGAASISLAMSTGNNPYASPGNSLLPPPMMSLGGGFASSLLTSGPAGVPLGFNPYLSLPSSRPDGAQSSEVEMRRSLLRGKEELELIMHPEMANEIAAETAVEEARLDAHREAEQEFIELTSVVAGVAPPTLPQPPPTAGGLPFSATLDPVAEDEHGASVPVSARGRTPRTPRTPVLGMSVPPFNMAGVAAAAAGGTPAAPGTAPVGVDRSAFMAQLAGNVEAAFQPLYDSQRTLVQGQRGLMQHQRELEQLVAELGL